MKPSTAAVLDLIRHLDGACPQDFAEQIHTASPSGGSCDFDQDPLFDAGRVAGGCPCASGTPTNSPSSEVPHDHESGALSQHDQIALVPELGYELDGWPQELVDLQEVFVGMPCAPLADDQRAGEEAEARRLVKTGEPLPRACALAAMRIVPLDVIRAVELAQMAQKIMERAA